MADLARIKANVAKMAAQNAPEADIDGYIASEGVSLEDVRNFKPGHNAPEFKPVGVENYNPATGLVEPNYGMAGSAAMGAADTATMGFGDEIASVLGSAISGKPRSQVLSEMRGNAAQAQEQNPGSYLAGQIGGGVASGGALARSGLSLGVNAASRGAGLGRVAAGGAADGAILGGAHGVGSGTDLESRAIGGAAGTLLGAGMGAVAPYAVAGASRLAQPLVAPVMARLRPEEYANRAMVESLRRSGRTNAEITQALRDARADGQDMFTLADAMGNAGQRVLSTAARNPHDGRQALIESLQARQMGQGDRLSSALAEGFAAPDTAAQRTAALTANRSTTADTNYGLARQGAGPTNLNGAIAEIDRLLGRDPILGDTALSQGPLGARLSALRDMLQRDGEQLVDFDRVLNIKSDMFQQMQRNPNVANDLRGVYNQLDAALENASDGYRAANDTFRQQSRVIDAVDTGRGATSGRTRAQDNIQTFGRMTPDEQNAFRAGYVDPLISRVESMSMSPTTNKARPLITEKSGQEFPAFAAPGRGEQMGRRIAREQRMFETANAALGGSKTADNLADAADLNAFDPSIMTNLMQGRPVAAAISAVTKALNESRGMPPSVLTQLSRALMETNPDIASRLLAAGTVRNTASARQRAMLSEILVSLQASGTARAINP